MTDGTTYSVRRFYQQRATRVIKTGLTLEQAQAHCNDPETSSRTCTRPEGKEHTASYGPWFDGYETETKS